MTGKELWYISQAHNYGHLSGNGPFTKKCQEWLEENLGIRKSLLTHSCTAALEMAAILAEIKPGDEVIMPSYTFVSTANAFVLRGGIPVFVDIRPDTLNMDETMIEAAITERSKAIVPVHYAGVACEMDAIMALAARYNLLVIEDSAQSILCSYKGKTLGSIGHMAAVSFHETKNIISGEGGTLLINDPRFIDRAEVIWEKGTNRTKFFEGVVDKYTWVDIGSSYLPGELISSFLWAQMEEAKAITEKRIALWNLYHKLLSPAEENGLLRRPVLSPHCSHNAHMYYIILPDSNRRSGLLKFLREKEIGAIFHYIPLHSSPAGKRFGRTSGVMKHTDDLSERIVRLPLWIGMNEGDIEYICNSIQAFLKK